MTINFKHNEIFCLKQLKTLPIKDKLGITPAQKNFEFFSLTQWNG